MTTIEPLEQFLKVQLQAWGREGNGEGIRGPIIAITREPGCGGEAIAQRLAKELGLVLHDCEIVEEIARNAHVSEQVVATLDTKIRPELDDWLAGFMGGLGLTSSHYMQCLRKVLFTIATHGNAVIVGRGANFLLPPGKKTLGLSLVAPLEARVKNIMQALSLSREDALKHIHRTERDQRLWVKKYGHADINDATHYHMVINTSLIEPDTIVQLAKELIKAKT